MGCSQGTNYQNPNPPPQSSDVGGGCGVIGQENNDFGILTNSEISKEF